MSAALTAVNAWILPPLVGVAYVVLGDPTFEREDQVVKLVLAYIFGSAILLVVLAVVGGIAEVVVS